MSRSYYFNIQPLTVAATVGVATLVGIYLFYYKRKRTSLPPTEWTHVGKVTDLYMYPLKSGRRVKLESAFCTEFGFQIKNKDGFQLRDRCLVIYNESDKEVRTARTFPKMILIEITSKDSNQIILNVPGRRSLQLEIPSLSKSTPEKLMSFFNETIFMLDCGDEAAQWVSQYILDKPSGLRLGFHDGLHNHHRNIDNTHQKFMKHYPHLENASMGLFSDLSSYMLVNRASVDEVLNKVSDPNITIHNFRPNIVVEGADLKPYDEINWDWVKIGDVVMRNVKLCARCVLTTMDPERGIQTASMEPLKTLKTYRKVKDLVNIKCEENDPIMGINLGLRYGGEINIGDEVFIGRN